MDDTTHPHRTTGEMETHAAELAAIVEASADAIVRVDVDGTVVSWNRGAERLYGYPAEQMIGRSIELLVPQDRRHEPRELIDRTIREGQVEQYEAVRLRRDGRRIEISLTLSAIRDGGGGLVGIAAVSRDITAHQQAEKRFHMAVEGSPYGKMLVEPDGTVSLVNRAAEQLFGYTRQELIGQAVESLVPLRYRQGHPELRASYMTEPTARPVGADRTLFARRKDGTEVPVEIALNPLITTGGVVVLATIADVSQQRRTAAALKRAVAELRSQNQHMEEFVYTVSHDLKSPLVTISGMVGYLKSRLQQGHTDDLEEVLETVEQTAVRTRERIDDLLDLSRVARSDRSWAPVPLDEVVAQVLGAHERTIAERGVAVEVHGPLPTVTGDRQQIERVLDNLVANALKYGCDGAAPRIEVGGGCEDGAARVFVRDHGPGIDPRLHERVFRLFTRGSTDKEGSGVGLALVRRVMDIHNGRTWVESDLDRGAAFWIEFPEAEGRTHV